MKTHHVIFATIVILIFGTSCSEDWLEVEAESALYADEYYTTSSRIFEALVGAYDPLNWFDWYEEQYNQLDMLADVMADDVYVGGSDENDCKYLHRMANYDAISTSVCSDAWKVCYKGVYRANNVLENIDNVTDISDSLKTLYIAEAKVLRAFYYTWLWKLWGNIPYYEKNLEEPYTAEQYVADSVYSGIITTLEDAIDNGNLQMKASDEWSGRVTLAMTYMLYTEVVMYQKDDSRYNHALNYMEEIINSGEYSLVDDFSSIWEEDGEWCSESIWEFNYFSTNGGRAWDNTTGDGGTVYPKLIGVYSLSGSSDYDSGWGFEPVKEDAYNMYDSDDQRRDGGILNIEEYIEETGASYTARYQDEGYFLKKYLPRSGGNDGYAGSADMNYSNNFRIYRYSETLLNAAELITLGASGSGSAQRYLDEVRTRAGVSSVDPTVENIINERRLEFLGEGKRYWDLIRSDLATTYLVPDNYRTNTWSESKKYLPIPQEELDADGNLVQNDY